MEGLPVCLTGFNGMAWIPLPAPSSHRHTHADLAFHVSTIVVMVAV
jgi:hypothetical protein